MAIYLLPCKCGSQFSIATFDAGKTLECADCGAETVVPNLREIRELPQADESSNAKELAWDKHNGLLFALGSILIALGVGLAGFHFYQASQLDLTDETNEQIIYGNAVIDQMDPLGAIKQWRLVRDIGLGEQQIATFQQNESRYKTLHLYAYIEIGVAALGLLLIVVASLARKQVHAPSQS